MTSRVKRTYNLPERTVHRVRELAAGGAVGSSQDAVVETAVERLYELVRADEEARRWAEAADDAAFRAEMATIGRDLDEPDSWPA
jgi:hypothetical protein